MGDVINVDFGKRAVAKPLSKEALYKAAAQNLASELNDKEKKMSKLSVNNHMLAIGFGISLAVNVLLLIAAFN